MRDGGGSRDTWVLSWALVGDWGPLGYRGYPLRGAKGPGSDELGKGRACPGPPHPLAQPQGQPLPATSSSKLSSASAVGDVEAWPLCLERKEERGPEGKWEQLDEGGAESKSLPRGRVVQQGKSLGQLPGGACTTGSRRGARAVMLQGGH